MMPGEIESVADDQRPIIWVAWSDGNALLKVGQYGITKIVTYREYGQMGYVPWLAIYKGDELWQRIDVQGKEIGYAL